MDTDVSTPFGRTHHEEQLCEIILNLGQWFRRRCRLKDFLSGALAAPLTWWSQTIYAILKDGITGKKYVKLYGIRTSGSKDFI